MSDLLVCELCGKDYERGDSDALARDCWCSAKCEDIATPPGGFVGKCPKCGEELGFGHIPAICRGNNAPDKT